MAAAEGGRYLSKALLGRGSERSRLCRVPALPPPGPLPLLHLSSSQGASAPWSRWDPRALSVGRCAAASGAREDPRIRLVLLISHWNYPRRIQRAPLPHLEG